MEVDQNQTELKFENNIYNVNNIEKSNDNNYIDNVINTNLQENIQENQDNMNTKKLITPIFLTERTFEVLNSFELLAKFSTI